MNINQTFKIHYNHFFISQINTFYNKNIHHTQQKTLLLVHNDLQDTKVGLIVFFNCILNCLL